MRLTAEHTHNVWDNSIEPVLRITPGDRIEVEIANSSGGQLDQASTAADLRNLDFNKVNPVTGPIWVDGAEPGDTLVIDIDDIAVERWGWTANIPGFGLLAADFPDPYLRLSTVSEGTISFGEFTMAAVPMIGTIGLAPAGVVALPMVPPHRQGGNMDIRHVTAGTRLRLPVAVRGALLSLGDTHAAMGDGEVCGTGIGPDLWQAVRDATRSLIEQVVRRIGLASVEAYLLASVAADLHISEIVDLPNVVVSIHLPLAVIHS